MARRRVGLGATVGFHRNWPASRIEYRYRTAPTSDGGSAITGYIVTPYHNGIAQTALQFKTTATTQTFALRGGILGCWSYVFRVAATNKSGTGPQSTSSNYVSWPCRY
jgi:hypothetical protein